MPATYRECRLTPEEQTAVRTLLERRIQERRPAAYLTHKAWFAGLEFYVDEQVLVPRSPMAELIESGFEPWIDSESIQHILDLGTGSGCIGIAAAVYLPDATVDLVDISPTALQVAARNARDHGVIDRVRLLESDLFAALVGTTYDLIISNPPYVPTEALRKLPPEYQQEPAIGLEAGPEGLDIVLRILRDAPDFLNEEGVLIVELGSTASTLERRFPDLPLLWVEFERGGEGVFLLTREQLLAAQPQFAQALEEQS